MIDTVRQDLINYAARTIKPQIVKSNAIRRSMMMWKGRMVFAEIRRAGKQYYLHFSCSMENWDDHLVNRRHRLNPQTLPDATREFERLTDFRERQWPDTTLSLKEIAALLSAEVNERSILIHISPGLRFIYIWWAGRFTQSFRYTKAQASRLLQEIRETKYGYRAKVVV